MESFGSMNISEDSILEKNPFHIAMKHAVPHYGSSQPERGLNGRSTLNWRCTLYSIHSNPYT